MTLDQLRIFVAVAEREHLTQAAEALNLTPSAVSSAIRVLEERYGIALFHRTGRRIELTETGHAFLPEARATLARAESTDLFLTEVGGLKRGMLTLAASQTVGAYWLPPLLIRFHAAYPAIDMRVASGNTEQVAEAVLEGQVELGFVEGAVDHPALSQRIVARDRVVVVAPAGHPLLGRPIEAEDLRAARWVLREAGSGTRSALTTALATHGVEEAALDIALSLPSNEAVRSAILAGGALTAISELAVADDLASGRLARIAFDLPERAFRLLRQKERYRSKASLALEALVRI
ncbi:LysR substrate-binding domain-containing protein [Shinella kummerowiae]|uniref:LysR substrate-binding domain-containing protein n=1 Tax=Shinella kummerowiae TaxID=417745 RepID=UPI0021B69614|nr:LysR substrate-binding domain-containing protein [Shinella kummerowiae]MCT7666514.1 LysR substrate-binding domain-containing protein [Shinella kummerowiae]